jgi:Iap family predicted aminopeptidase
VAEVFTKCISHTDLLAGSPVEREFLQWLLSFLDAPNVWFHLSPVEVYYWQDKGTRLEADGLEIRGLALPYSKSTSVEGRLVPLGKDIEGNIALAKFPSDVDDAKYIVLEAAEGGAAAVIFADYPPRRIVVTGDYGFRFDSAPTPLPVASFENIDYLIGKRVRLEINTSGRVTYSYSLVAFNSFENTPMISAHWDHWLVGATDNCAGVEASVLAFLELVAEEVPVALGLFTAEEGVAPHIPSLYWAWGSYNYLKKWRPTFLVNIDVVGVGSPRIYAVPYLHQVLKDLGHVEDPAPYFDTVHFERWGLPSVTISSLVDTWGVYHSPYDRHVSVENILQTAELAKRLVKIKPPAPEASVVEYGVPQPGDPYEAWSYIYNYLVLFKDYRHSDIVYTNIFQFLKKYSREYKRIDLIGGPTICIENCEEAVEVYRNLVSLGLFPL